MRIGVLVSGSGTNLQAILDAQTARTLGGEVTLVISNLAQAPALARARAAGVPTRVVAHADFAGREPFEKALLAELQDANVDLLVLAGFLRILTRTLLDPFGGRVINIHPSLLPAFPGMHAQRQALEHGVKVSGCTVHFVEVGCDTGPIIAQRTVALLDDDTEATLSARILTEEHRLYPAVIRALAEGRVTRDGRRVRLKL